MTYLVYHNGYHVCEHHLIAVIYLPAVPPTIISVNIPPPPPPRQLPLKTATTTREVFINFRGLDVRNTFIDHLQAALRRERVGAFRDDVDSGRGVNVKQGVLRAIEESRFYVVVLSRSYASSKWCLDELVKIMHCSNKHNKIAFPVFYHVSPEDVSAVGGGGCYKEDFDRHKKKYTYERVDGWLQALAWVVGVSGWVVASDQSEASLVESIARTVRRKVRNSNWLIG
ncbi:unnamed protein product [Linum tenue]|uniref:ADP-ribosyl cyclase/cyclic ADP-ribose hydrolase n=1 Tax=Linum tenue TaxID=586396 RepID=A0AAV0R108_9ROSI|nr:unnamed protein product [Linum tenue]